MIRGVFLHKGDAVHQVQSTLVSSTAGTTMQDVCQEQWDECQLISEVFSALTCKEETNGPTMGHSPGDYDGNTLSNLIEGHSMMGSSLKGMPLESASGSCRGITGGTLTAPTGTSPQLTHCTMAPISTMSLNPLAPEFVSSLDGDSKEAQKGGLPTHQVHFAPHLSPRTSGRAQSWESSHWKGTASGVQGRRRMWDLWRR